MRDRLADTFAVLAQIDGNLDALDAVLAALDRGGVATIACLGNLDEAGSVDRPCLARLRARSALIVRGCRDDDAAMLPAIERRGDDVFVHATPSDPLRGRLSVRRDGATVVAAAARFVFSAHDRDDPSVGAIAWPDPSLPPFDPDAIDY